MRYGYNRIKVAKLSRPKLVVAGPDCTKYTHNGMPLGPVNDLVVYSMFVHDIDAIWKDLANNRGIVFDAWMCTNITANSIFS